MGWRLPKWGSLEETQKGFIAKVTGAHSGNSEGMIRYKNTNTDLLGWIAEVVSGQTLRAILADIVDGAGLEGCLYMCTDRLGFPILNGGLCVSARDLARYMSLFVRGGRGVNGQIVGSQAFIERSLKAGIPIPAPYENMRYSNHLMVSGRTFGHTGWGGQCAMANLDTGTVCVFLSVLENQYGLDREYMVSIIRMLKEICEAGA